MPHPVDVHVGKRVREARAIKGMSQTALGNALGISFQQVQKYEKGNNRIGASRLWDISKVLDVSTAYFFEGLEDGSEDEDNVLPRRAIERARLIESIPDEGMRNSILNLITACVHGCGPAARSS